VAEDRLTILVLAKDLATRVLRGVTGTLQKVGISARGLATAFAAVAATATGIAFVGRKLFELGAAVGETRSKFETTFGAARETVNAFLSDFATMAGITRRQAQELTATTGAMALGMGQTADQAAQTAIQVARLGGDIASFNNLAGGTAEGLEIINSGLTGEFERLKRVGIVIKAAEVDKRALTDTGKKLVKQLTEEDRIQARLALITERAGVAVGDLARTSDSAANKARQLRARWQDIIDDFSAQLLPTLTTILTILENITPAAAAAAKTMSELANVGFLAFGGENAAFAGQRESIERATPQSLPILRRGLQSNRERLLAQQQALQGRERTQQDLEFGDTDRELRDLQEELDAVTRLLDLADTRLAQFNRSVAETAAAAAPGAAPSAGGTVLPGSRTRLGHGFSPTPAGLLIGQGALDLRLPDWDKVTEATRDVAKEMEDQAKTSAELGRIKRLEQRATAQLVQSLAGAATALIGIIRGTQGGGFFGVLGSLASIAGGVIGAVNPLAGAALLAGGGLVSALSSPGRDGGDVGVRVVNPRDIGQAIADIQGPLRVTNQLVAPQTGEVIREIEFELGRRTRLGKSAPVPFGTSFGG